MDNDSKTKRETPSKTWYPWVLATAAVAGGLTLVVCAVLTVNYFRFQMADPMDSPKMQQLRTAVREHPNDDSLRRELRQLDLQLREKYLRQQTFTIRGGLVLIGFMAIFVASGSVAGALRKKLPAPAGQVDPMQQQARRAVFSRWSVGICAIALAGAALLWMAVSGTFSSPRALKSARPGVRPIPPSWEDFPVVAQVVETRPVPGPTGVPTPEEIAKNWPRFRGPRGLGIARCTHAPSAWNGKTGEGILWKTPVPLPGENSPIVWGDRVFLTGADEYSREVYCFDANSGKLLWERFVEDVRGSSDEVPKVSKDAGYAASTAVTDGRHVCAIFANGDVACFDFAGKRLWARSLGIPKNTYGYGSSLTMYRNLLMVLFDQGEEEDRLSRLIALDVRSGRRVWERPRAVANSWATPIVIDTPSGPQLITCARPWVVAYDPTSGEEIWKFSGVEGDVAPSPIYAGGLVFAITPDDTLYAIRTDGKGDVTKTHIAWEADEGVPNITSPLSDGKVVFLLTSVGTVTCCELRTGKKLWEHELDDDFLSSPTLVGDRVYLLSEKGTAYIIAADKQFKLLGKAELGEPSSCSPAVVNERIYIRGKKHLFCVAESK